MCTRLLNVNSRSPYGQKLAFVPCGTCEECRDSMRSQWFFRLRSELDWCHKNKFHIGFFTLTYSEDMLPRIPEHLIHNRDLLYETGSPCCFSRSDVRTFIDNIRKRVFDYLKDKYKDDRSKLKSSDKRIRYMICSEFGSSSTQRSHYHGLICFPPDVDPKFMFGLIHHYWSENDPKNGLYAKGFVFPRDIRGGVDSHGYRHQPFLLSGDIARAAKYASKYCCKDLNYSRYILDYVVDTKHSDYKNCKCFHIQSKSIGLSYLSTLPNDKLLDILKNGVSYVGDNRRRSLPLYLKNKILFNPKYEFERAPDGDWYYDFEADKWRFSKGKGTHRRIVGKEASAFFYKNLDAIYNMKVEYYTQLFKDMQRKDFWFARVNPNRCCQHSPDVVKERCFLYAKELAHYDPQKLATGYLSYFGVNYSKAYFTSPQVAYLHRYVPKVYPETLPEFEPWSGSVPLVNRRFYEYVHRGLKWAIEGLRFCEGTDYEKRERVAKVSDFYKHAV